MARRRKVGYGDESIAPEGSDDDIDLSEFGLEDEKPKRKAKRIAKKGKKRADTKICSHCQDGYHDPEECPNPPWEEPVVDKDPAPTQTRAFGIDLSMECPVCRKFETCECEEEDRTFMRRIRFEDDVKKVARCPRCKAPLSVVYLPRPGAAPPFRLSQFEALHACSCCHTEAVACAVLAVKGPF